jgi:hypothetical protein
MAPKVQGRLGMTKKDKKNAKRDSMASNRKRDKARQRSSYHSQFKREKGKRGIPSGQQSMASLERDGFLK